MVRKKNIVFLIFIIFSWLFVVYDIGADRPAYNDEELFLQGQFYYHKGEYQKALECYMAIKQPGRAVFYNKGNCYKYLNKPVDALAWWHRAQKGASYKEYDALKSACDALKQGIQGDVSSGLFLGKMRDFFNRLFAPFSLLTVQILLLFFWYLFFLLLFYRKRVHWFFVCLFGTFVGIFFMYGGVWVKYRELWYPYALVRVETVPVYAGPDTKHYVLYTARFIDELRVREKIPGWCLVESEKGGGAGWVEEGALEIV